MRCGRSHCSLSVPTLLFGLDGNRGHGHPSGRRELIRRKRQEAQSPFRRGSFATDPALYARSVYGLERRIGIQFSLCGSAILSVEEALSTSRALPASKAAQLRMSIGSGENAESGKPRFFFIRSVSQPAHAEILERRLYGCHLFVRQSPVPSAIRHHAEVMKKKFDPAMAVDEHANRIFGFTKVRYRGIWKSHQWLCAAFALVNLYQHRNRLAPQTAQCLRRPENVLTEIKKTSSNPSFPTENLFRIKKSTALPLSMQNHAPVQRFPSQRHSLLPRDAPRHKQHPPKIGRGVLPVDAEEEPKVR